MIKIKHFSDTHNMHGSIIPETFVDSDVNVVIFSGDCSNPRDPYRNSNEVLDFIEWYKNVNCKYKIFVAGNHDSSIEARIINRSTFTDNGIIYLENEGVTIEGLRFYGSPYTPTFGNWSFMKARHKIHEVWDNAETEIDVLITHGPPLGYRDLTYERDNSLVMVGDRSLMKYVHKIRPELHCFGHIHNSKDIVNQGVTYHNGIMYSNGACVEDGKFDKGLISFGNIITI